MNYHGLVRFAFHIAPAQWAVDWLAGIAVAGSDLASPVATWAFDDIGCVGHALATASLSESQTSESCCCLSASIRRTSLQIARNECG